MNIDDLDRHEEVADHHIVDTFETTMHAVDQLHIGQPLGDKPAPDPVAPVGQDTDSVLPVYFLGQGIELEFLKLDGDRVKKL